MAIDGVRKIACQGCGKIYSVPSWSKQPRCRVCGTTLQVDDRSSDERPNTKRTNSESRAA